MMLLQSKLVTGILAGPNLYPGTPGLTLNQSKALGTGSNHGTHRTREEDQSWAQSSSTGKSTDR